MSSFVPVVQGLSETTYSEGFTLGLSKLSEPDITTDIVHCNTALYAQSDAMASNFSMVATQDKPTVMASQLQRQMEDEVEVKSKLGMEKSVYRFHTEEVVEPQDEECFFNLEEDVDGPESQKANRKSTAEDQHKHGAAVSKLEEGVAENQTSVRQDTPSYEEGEDIKGAQTEEESPQTDKDAISSSQSEEEEVAAHSLSKVGEDAGDSQTEHDDAEVNFQPQEDVAATSLSHSEGEEVASDTQTEEEGTARSQTGEEDAVDSQQDAEDRSQSEDDSQTGPEQLEHNVEHISRRSYRSEGGLVTVTDENLVDTTGAGKGEKTYCGQQLQLFIIMLFCEIFSSTD